jgi:hypothetical protein
MLSRFLYNSDEKPERAVSFPVTVMYIFLSCLAPSTSSRAFARSYSQATSHLTLFCSVHSRISLDNKIYRNVWKYWGPPPRKTAGQSSGCGEIGKGEPGSRSLRPQTPAGLSLESLRMAIWHSDFARHIAKPEHLPMVVSSFPPSRVAFERILWSHVVICVVSKNPGCSC